MTVKPPVFVPVVAFDGQTGCVMLVALRSTAVGMLTTMFFEVEHPKSLNVTVTLYVPALKPVKVLVVVVSFDVCKAPPVF